MCLAMPVRVIACLNDDRARVELDGVEREVSVALIDDLQVGDYVILHVGYAIGKLNAEEAEKTLALMDQLAQLPSPTGAA